MGFLEPGEEEGDGTKKIEKDEIGNGKNEFEEIGVCWLGSLVVSFSYYNLNTFCLSWNRCGLRCGPNYGALTMWIRVRIASIDTNSSKNGNLKSKKKKEKQKDFRETQSIHDTLPFLS